MWKAIDTLLEDPSRSLCFYFLKGILGGGAGGVVGEVCTVIVMSLPHTPFFSCGAETWGILVPPPGVEPRTTRSGSAEPHWTSREFPPTLIFA